MRKFIAPFSLISIDAFHQHALSISLWLKSSLKVTNYAAFVSGVDLVCHSTYNNHFIPSAETFCFINPRQSGARGEMQVSKCFDVHTRHRAVSHCIQCDKSTWHTRGALLFSMREAAANIFIEELCKIEGLVFHREHERISLLKDGWIQLSIF